MNFLILPKRIIQGVLYLLRNVFSSIFKLDEISILTYHSIADSDDETTVSVGTFERQLNFLKKSGYYFATLSEIVSYVKDKKPLPSKTVAITIDDGYADSYKNAFPLFKKYRIPATIFIVSDFAKMKQRTGTNLLPLSESEKNEMMLSGLIDFQSHSKSHVMLDSISRDEIEDEVERGAYAYFAYPGGHYNEVTREVVKKSGYAAAFSIKPGLVRREDDLFVMRRNVILGSMTHFDFRIRVTKAIDWYTKLVNIFK